MKVYIVGSVACGKSTLARRMSQITGIPCTHLDEVVHVADANDSWGNNKRPVDVRDALFNGILAQKHYIMEDTGRECFMDGMRQADKIVWLDLPLIVRQKRILIRWLKQNLGIEKSLYIPRLAVLKAMFRWTKNYETGADGTKVRIASFKNKTIILRNNKDVKRYLKSLPKVSRR
jgi:adenylate kinase family enzyme